jgi:hypothetical protein
MDTGTFLTLLQLLQIFGWLLFLGVAYMAGITTERYKQKNGIKKLTFKQWLNIKVSKE